MKTASLVVGVLLIAVVAANAMTGEDLAAACHSQTVQCESYLAGCLDSRESFLEWHYLIENMYCASGDFSIDEARRVFLRYAEQHPHRLRERASALLFTALAETLPCE